MGPGLAGLDHRCGVLDHPAALSGATDVSSARGEKPDVIIGQKMHTEDFEGKAPVVVGISNFTDKEAIKEKLRGPFKEQGWIE